MKNRIQCLAVVSLLSALAMGCGNSSRQAAFLAKSAAAARGSAGNPEQDYTKPYLNEAKMQKFLDSMKEGENPFEFLFGQAGKTGNLADLVSGAAKLDEFARKYGFQGYQDYMAVWGRIAVGQATILGEGMKKSAHDMMQQSIQTAQDQLKKPDLNPDMRKMFESQIADQQKSLADLDKPSPSELNDNDLGLVRKYNDQINEAAKKYTQSAPAK